MPGYSVSGVVYPPGARGGGGLRAKALRRRAPLTEKYATRPSSLPPRAKILTTERPQPTAFCDLKPFCSDWQATN